MFKKFSVIFFIICFLLSLIGCSTNSTSEPNETIEEDQVSEEVTPSIPVNSDDDFTYSIDGDSVEIIKYIGEKNMVGIPSTIQGLEVTTIGIGAFEECKNLIAVHIPNSISLIGQYAFLDCRNLTDVNIPDSVTTIGFGAFQGCSNIKRITLPNNQLTMYRAAFQYCNNLESVTVPENVTDIAGGAFGTCSSLKQFKVDKNNPVYSSYDGDLYDKEKTTLLFHCRGKSKINFSPNIIKIGDEAFINSDSITDLTIPDTVTSIGQGAFSNTKFTNITIPGTVTSIGQRAFSNTKFTNITIPGTVTHMGKFAFLNCDNLSNVIISDGVTEISERAFQGCDNLLNINIPNSVIEIEYYAFLDCDNLTITCKRNSYAEEYAIEHDIPVSYKD